MDEDSSQKDQNCENTVNIKDDNSSENFQKFIYELFEKNGVLSDLRAYLRGHIVNVLKNVNTGEPPMCQKHFAQRLELTFQALNILVAEYLLRLDFTYSLSVFISEIPLANMVFDLANSLLQTKTDDDYKDLRFKDSDVWCVLNYLGIKCDSETASNIVYMYREEAKYPLLLCILKCLPMFHKQPETFECVNTSEASMSGSSKVSVDSYMKSAGKKTNSLTICKHYAFCDSCKQRMARIQRKYKYKKEALYKMFSQLRTVYETEVEMVREEEERKIKRSLANHALILQKRYDEMEESFKARELELESNVQEKKKFLWGLARALRDQHSNMSVAMDTVQMETERLNNKEEVLQNQIKEAEHTLRKRGEEMRNQITNEMIQLESRLNSMRIERDEIERERCELEKLKEICDSNTKISLHNIKERDELNSQYDLLRDELSCLKKHFSNKCLVETGVMTDKEINTGMNNEQDIERAVRSEDIRRPNQLVNDLKKLKNVNFNQSNLEDMTEGSRSSLLESAAERGRHLESMLRHENDRLKAFAEQQREHIDELAREQVRLRAELVAARLGSPRPRTAPSLLPPTQGVNPSGVRGACGLRRGAGEELSVFPQPRTLLPTDPIPFLGTLSHTRADRHADRHADTRRYMINQWRGLRRLPPATPPAPPAPQPGSSTQHEEEMNVRQREQQEAGSCVLTEDKEDSDQQPPEIVIEGKKREKSPKSVLREAKQKLRNKDIKKQEANTSREKSPNSMLREAKLRLRKLEIEAEAVEKSYMDFKRRRNELRREDEKFTEESVPVVGESSHNLIAQSSTMEKNKEVIDNDDVNVKVTKDFSHSDFDKYFREYQNKEIMKPYFSNKTTTANKIKPIPIAYKMADDTEVIRNVDYINTPLNEFRKLYHNDKPRRVQNIQKEITNESVIDINETNKDIKKIDLEKSDVLDEINLNNQIYEISNDNIPCRDDIENDEKSLLKVELDNIDSANVKIDEGDLMVVIETSIASELTVSQDDINPVSIIVTPKDLSDNTKESKSSFSIKSSSKSKESPEKAARLTRKDVLNAIFDIEAKDISNGDICMDDSKDGFDSIVADSDIKDIGDEFLADVDNYNSRSDLGNSPISHAKTSDDEIFWD
ncbi:Oral-facial-digital syndrome 1 protein-like [Papilio xuthus]|uniref:Oral-facial-digital syndrome 1 protein-like n=1 Tax=Papilio xuthus TaxID=66420 RepID=A0A194Q569_PAPXU|nr:Oral-facial-digital syndrome 1 protein-like [Papilio xuthus]